MMKLNSIFKTALFAFFLSPLGAAVMAQFTFSGEVRPRMEYRHGYSTLVDKDVNPAFFTSQRTRLNALYNNSKVKLGITIQDVTLWGSQPQLFKTSNDLMVHQAWAEYSFTDEFSLKVGRMELVYDDQRIFGNSNWHQQARSHDLLLLKYSGPVVVNAGAAFNQSSPNLTGMYYDVKNNYKMMQFLWIHSKLSPMAKISLLFLNNGYQYNHTATNGGTLSKNIFNQTYGGRFVASPSKMMFHVSGYYTHGKDMSDRDLSAYYLAAGADFDLTKHWQFGVGWELLSGTSQKEIADHPTTYTNRSFNPFYGTGHKFNGFMDYFYVDGNWNNSVGLNDLFADFQFTKRKNEVNITGHFFWAAADVLKTNSTTLTMEKFLGAEIDLTYSYKLTSNSNVSIGYSQMLGTQTLQVLKGGDREAWNNWAYVMFTFKPVFLK
jgi:hypothetical protein